jgi:altronate dehydratase small subunit
MGGIMNLALKTHDDDNIAIVFASEVKGGDVIFAIDKAGNRQQITVASLIPYGHKVATCFIPKGAVILKYGESIGISSKDIAIGEHVHVHNLESTRGRGDL